MVELRNIKIWIGNKPELCRKVQQYLFKNGCRWFAGKKVQFEDSDALYVDSLGVLTFSKETLIGKKDYFDSHGNMKIDSHLVCDEEPVVVIDGIAYI